MRAALLFMAYCLLHVARAQPSACNENWCSTSRRRFVTTSSCVGGDSTSSSLKAGDSGSCSCSQGKPHFLREDHTSGGGQIKVTTNRRRDQTAWYFTCCTGTSSLTDQQAEIRYNSSAAGQVARVVASPTSLTCGPQEEEVSAVGAIIFWVCICGCCAGGVYMAFRMCGNDHRGGSDGVPATATLQNSITMRRQQGVGEFAPSAQQQQLPPGWTQAMDQASGRTYYVDPQQQTHWEPPMQAQQPSYMQQQMMQSQHPQPAYQQHQPMVAAVAPVPSSSTPLPPGWTSAVDPSSGNTYYIDPQQQTHWDMPMSKY
jgi:hypothetical protein